MTRTYRSDAQASRTFRDYELAEQRAADKARHRRRRAVMNDFSCGYLLGHLDDEGNHTNFDPDDKVIRHVQSALTRGQ